MGVDERLVRYIESAGREDRVGWLAKIPEYRELLREDADTRAGLLLQVLQWRREAKRGAWPRRVQSPALDRLGDKLIAKGLGRLEAEPVLALLEEAAGLEPKALRFNCVDHQLLEAVRHVAPWAPRERLKNACVQVAATIREDFARFQEGAFAWEELVAAFPSDGPAPPAAKRQRTPRAAKPPPAVAVAEATARLDDVRVDEVGWDGVVAVWTDVTKRKRRPFRDAVRPALRRAFGRFPEEMHKPSLLRAARAYMKDLQPREVLADLHAEPSPGMVMALRAAGAPIPTGEIEGPLRASGPLSTAMESALSTGGALNPPRPGVLPHLEAKRCGALIFPVGGIDAAGWSACAAAIVPIFGRCREVHALRGRQGLSAVDVYGGSEDARITAAERLSAAIHPRPVFLLEYENTDGSFSVAVARCGTLWAGVETWGDAWWGRTDDPQADIAALLGMPLDPIDDMVYRDPVATARSAEELHGPEFEAALRSRLTMGLWME